MSKVFFLNFLVEEMKKNTPAKYIIEVTAFTRFTSFRIIKRINRVS